MHTFGDPPVKMYFFFKIICESILCLKRQNNTIFVNISKTLDSLYLLQKENKKMLHTFGDALNDGKTEYHVLCTSTNKCKSHIYHIIIQMHTFAHTHTHTLKP